jgi:hypothetical protein
MRAKNSEVRRRKPECGLLRTVLALCLVASGLGAQDLERNGNQMFRIPAGWARNDVQDSVILSPNSAPKNAVVVVMGGHASTGSLREGFDRNFKASAAGQRVVTSSEPQSRTGPNGVEMLEATAELQGAKGPPSYCLYLVAAPPGRIEMMVYMASSKQLFQRYLQDARQVAASWTFANVSAAPAAGPDVSTSKSETAPPSGRLSGVFQGYKYNYTTTLGVVQKTASIDYFTFFPDGTVYHGLPSTGMVGFNMVRANQTNPEISGTYRIEGDHLMVVLNRGTYRLDASVRSPAQLEFEGRPYTLQSDPADGPSHALEGVFVRADARPGEDLARRAIRFSSNGQFVDQGMVETVAGTEIVNGNLRFERPSGSGTYKLSQFTLILRYSDGYVRQLPIIVKRAELDKPTPAEIMVNTYTLVRR